MTDIDQHSPRPWRAVRRSEATPVNVDIVDARGDPVAQVSMKIIGPYFAADVAAFIVEAANTPRK